MKRPPIIFWATPAFALPPLAALADASLIRAVVTQPDAKRGRGRTVAAADVKKAAMSRSLPCLTPSDIRSAEFRQDLKKFLPATFLVVAYGALIPLEILSLSELPAVNLHPSLLPLLRGASPIQTALLDGLPQTGITLMQLDEKMDHGPVLAQKKVAIQPADTFETLSEKLSFTAAQFLGRTVPQYLAHELRPVPQDHARATYTNLISKEDGLLDFTQRAERLNNMIRAFNPWPGTFFFWNGRRIKILSARVVPRPRGSKLFTASDEGRLIIGCGSGALEIMTIQPDAKKAMSSVDFLRGYAAILRAEASGVSFLRHPKI